MDGYQLPQPYPYIPGGYQPQPYRQAPPVMQVTRVNGEGGARAFSMGPNSSALLLDESGVIVWLVTTDGAGYKSVSPYDITPHQAAPAVDVGALSQRVARLEEIINGASANSATAKRNQNASKPGNGATGQD